MDVQERLLTHSQQEMLVVGCVLFFSVFSKCHQGVMGGCMG